MLTRLSIPISTVLILMILAQSCLADLSPKSYKETSHDSQAKELLEKMAEAHGVKNWDSIASYEIVFEDQFYGFIGKNSSPFDKDSSRFLLSYTPKTFDGELQFLDGKLKGQIWGIDDWQSYTQDSELSPKVYAKNKNIEFWLPTYQYFIEFPTRILRADRSAYIGEKLVDGVLCEGLLISWKSLAPQKDIDQYRVWLNKENHRIVKIDYTIRDFFRFLTGGAIFKDLQSYNGILLPSVFEVESNLSKRLHEMRIIDFNPIYKTGEQLKSSEKWNDDKPLTK